MWLDPQGAVHTEAVANPVKVFAPEFLRRALGASRQQLDEAIAAIEDYTLELVESVRSGVVDDLEVSEDAYVNAALPERVEITNNEQLNSLAAVIMENLLQTPIRWRPDLAFAATDALYDLRPRQSVVFTWLSRRRVLRRAGLEAP